MLFIVSTDAYIYSLLFEETLMTSLFWQIDLLFFGILISDNKINVFKCLSVFPKNENL